MGINLKLIKKKSVRLFKKLEIQDNNNPNANQNNAILNCISKAFNECKIWVICD